MKIARSIKFSKAADEVIEEMRKEGNPKLSYNYIVEHLVETNPEFVAKKKKLKGVKKK